MSNSEIDVSKCEFYCEKYDGCYCFNSSNEVYAVNPNEHNSCEANKDCYYRQLQQLKATLDDIEEITKDFHLSMIIFHKGATHEMADRIDYYLDKIKQLIEQTKEGE